MRESIRFPANSEIYGSCEGTSAREPRAAGTASELKKTSPRSASRCYQLQVIKQRVSKSRQFDVKNRVNQDSSGSAGSLNLFRAFVRTTTWTFGSLSKVVMFSSRRSSLEVRASQQYPRRRHGDLRQLRDVGIEADTQQSRLTREGRKPGFDHHVSVLLPLGPPPLRSRTIHRNGSTTRATPRQLAAKSSIWLCRPGT